MTQSLLACVERLAWRVEAVAESFFGQSRCQCCPPQWRHGRHCVVQALPSAGRSLRASWGFFSSAAV
eukprot:5387424-Pleurochrysis_carterae.AAC.1